MNRYAIIFAMDVEPVNAWNHLNASAFVDFAVRIGDGIETLHNAATGDFYPVTAAEAAARGFNRIMNENHRYNDCEEQIRDDLVALLLAEAAEHGKG